MERWRSLNTFEKKLCIGLTVWLLVIFSLVGYMAWISSQPCTQGCYKPSEVIITPDHVIY